MTCADDVALLIANGIGQDVLQAMYDTVDDAVAAAPAERDSDR